MKERPIPFSAPMAMDRLLRVRTEYIHATRTYRAWHGDTFTDFTPEHQDTHGGRYPYHTVAALLANRLGWSWSSVSHDDAGREFAFRVGGTYHPTRERAE